MPELRNMITRLMGGRKPITTGGFELVNAQAATFTPWSGNVYDNDIARAAIWTTAEAASKATFIHARGEGVDMRISPDPVVRTTLEQPNEYLTMQHFIAKMVIHLEKYNNAFALINRDTRGRPIALYPLDYSSVTLRESRDHEIYCRFRFRGMREVEVPYRDVVHLRKHFDSDEFFGDSNKTPLAGLMEIINVTDQGIVNAVRNSAVISWLLKFKQTLKPEDIKEQVKRFSETYLNTANNGWAAAPTDPRYDAEQVKRESFVPNAPQMEKAIQRIYAYYGTNNAIIQKSYTEDQWNAWYEGKIEPILMQLAQQMTMKFFSAHERTFRNRIVPETACLQYASMSTKLNLVSMVDRGALLPNEWRGVLNLAPVEGGDKPLRRLDTQTVDTPQAKKEEIPLEEERSAKRPQESRHDWLFEMRSATPPEDSGALVEGRAITFDMPALMYECDGIKYFEVIARGALSGADISDVPMRYNHSESFMIVARHNSARPNRSNMELIVDDSGLLIRADLSKTNSGRELYEAIQAGLVDKMSFAFSVAEESYDSATHTRTILKIKKLWDVSAVDTPAYDTTSIYARNRFQAEAESEKQVAEATERRGKQLALEVDTLLSIYGR